MTRLARNIFIFSILVLLLLHPTKSKGDDFKLLSSVFFKQEYNDNIFFNEDNETDDFITTVSLGIDLDEKTERLNASLKGRLDGVSYLDNSNLNSIEHFYIGHIRYQINPKISVSSDVGYTKDARPDRDIETTGLVLSDVEREREDYALSSDYMLSERTAGVLSWAYHEDEFDDREFVDLRSHKISLGVNHNLSYFFPSTFGRMNFGYTRYDLTGLMVENYSWTMGGSCDFSETLSALIDIGPRYSHSEFEGGRYIQVAPFYYLIENYEEENNEWGSAGQITLSYKGELSNASLTFFQDISGASGRDGTVERTAIIFRCDRSVTYKLRGNITAGYYMNKTNQDDFWGEEIDEETLRIYPQIRYDLTEEFSLETSYTFTRIKDNETNATANRNLVYLRLIFHYALFE